MEFITGIIDFILHIDVHLEEIISSYGILSYLILFFIVFAETGLVFMPLLPGDSLLFAAGTFAALGSFNIFFLLILLFVAAVGGDTVNYWIGRFFGQKIIDSKRFPINQKHIDKTQKFYDAHGGKTIFLARFIPIIRTFAPFVAGIGKMDYKNFFYYNVLGGFTWVFGFTMLGFLFGNIPGVKHNFSLVILAIILLSVVPVAVEFIKAKFSNKQIEK